MTEIRSACLGDAGFIARTILSSQRGPMPRGWFDVTLGWPEGQCLEFITRIAVARSTSWWHTSQFLIAEVDGCPAAALCALPSAGTGAAAWRAIAEVAADSALSASELEGIRRRGTYTRACWVQGADGDWLIEHVACEISRRGRGLVQALIEQALGAGRAAGFQRASISFLIGNEPAERCYAKAGFSFCEEKRDPTFEAVTGAPGFRRFVRPI